MRSCVDYRSLDLWSRTLKRARYTTIAIRPGRTAPALACAALELQLKAGLEELRLADEAEAVERTIPISHLEPHVVGDIPVHHRRESPELAALQGSAIEVDVREVRHQFPGSGSSLKHSTSR